MCGIVATYGQSPALPTVMDGLSRLEYRGYDSAGVALSHPGSGALVIHRALGPLSALIRAIPAPEQAGEPMGIGHTRWATHGGPSRENAHPHRDCSGAVAVVHNGTIDNAAELRTALTLRGHTVATEVDTELIAHLIEDTLAGRDRLDDLVEAVAAAAAQLRGSWALAVTAAGVDGIVVTRRRSPLLVAYTADAVMASSDVLGFSGDVLAVHELADGDLVTLGPNRTMNWSNRDLMPINQPRALPIPTVHTVVDRGGSPDFTGKEIAEQPELVQRLLERIQRGLITDLNLAAPDRVRLIACGSSAYAAQVTARVLTSTAGIAARVITASEHASDLAEGASLTIAFSQSGETADVLAARERSDGPWLSITNNPHSSLARRSDAVLDLACGPELGVAATKSFTAQVVVGTALALAFARGGDAVPAAALATWQALLSSLPDRLAATDALNGPIAAQLAADLAAQPGWIYISRGAGVPYAYEGALKLKELAYRWTEALPAGELKHGPIALIQTGVPVITIHAEPTHKLAVNISELAARGAHIITVGGPNATMPVVLPDTEPPWGPLESVIALQRLARETTRHLGYNVDRPRNLAKSVTVE